MAGSYSSSIFSFLRNLHTDLHDGYANLHSLQRYIRALPTTPQSLTAFVHSLSDWSEMESVSFLLAFPL
jgi:hypothetical protein